MPHYVIIFYFKVTTSFVSDYQLLLVLSVSVLCTHKITCKSTPIKFWKAVNNKSCSD